MRNHIWWNSQFQASARRFCVMIQTTFDDKLSFTAGFAT